MPPIIREPLLSPAIKIREAQHTSLADLIRLVALSIADAQMALDQSSAGVVKDLAETPVEIIPSIRETIARDGTVEYEHGKPRQVSLLDLGVMPTFYQFSQTVIEIQMDLKISEATTESGNKLALMADTAGIRFERKLNRDVSMASKITATLVPVPMPLGIEPVRTRETE